VITELHLTNFRGFEDHVVPLKPFTIVVGRNNAGKSTIVEALRLISIVVSRFKGELTSIPSRWEFPQNRRGLHPFKNLEINLQSIFHSYGEPPAFIHAQFSTGEMIEVTITRDEIFARRIRSRLPRSFTPSGLSRVSILPQVAPVAREERILTEDYVRGALSSALAPLHFRNQLHLLKEHFPAFKDAAEKTWPGLRIRGLETTGEIPDPIFLSLFVEDHHFPAEISWMGHGLQMWLQMIWFLSRSEDHETVILDEPDVYMHADLQRRLVRFVRNRHQQVIIATHSSEIMAEVLPDNILVVDRSRKRSDFASSLPAVQKVLTGFGSIHNLQLSRLWSARRFLMVEGEDVVLLKQFQNKLFPETSIPIDTIPSTSVGGWGGWNQAVGSDMLLKNAGGDGIVTYSIFDSDYHPTEAIRVRYTEAKQRGLSLHIWHRKELENYLLVASAIRRAINNQLSIGKVGPALSEVEHELEDIAEKLKQEVIDCIATHIQSADRKLTVATANQRAREIVSNRWKTHADRMGVIPGKEAMTRVSRWVQEKYKVSVSGLLIAHHMIGTELPQEMQEVLTAIEECEAFPERKFDTSKKTDSTYEKQHQQ
jgi:energy-coupling factor transporter ATP-binding protein EcfA2